MATDLATTYDRMLAEHGAALRRAAAIYEADPSRQDDLLQDICLALWRALPSFRGDASRRTWMFRIAHNRGLSHGWKRGRTREREVPADDERDGEIAAATAPAEDDPEQVTLARDRRRRLRTAVRDLPTGLRQVLTLSLEGLPQAQIGEVLGISESNVAVRLHRARKALRQRLEASDRAGDERTDRGGAA